MGIIEILNQVVQVIREGSFVEALRLLPIEDQRRFVIDEVNRQEARDFSFRALNDPSSNRGTSFAQSGPSDLKLQRELDIIAAKTDTPPVYAGL